MKKRNIERGFSVKRPKNEAEGMFFDIAKEAGFTATKRGWPDFFCVDDDGHVCCVEVKPRSTDNLKSDQAQIMKYLSRAGIKCFKWSPDGGLEPVS
jgi:Holliday junction resolvase